LQFPVSRPGVSSSGGAGTILSRTYIRGFYGPKVSLKSLNIYGVRDILA
jgi:hypothetical protein